MSMSIWISVSLAVLCDKVRLIHKMKTCTWITEKTSKEWAHIKILLWNKAKSLSSQRFVFSWNIQALGVVVPYGPVVKFHLLYTELWV